MENINLKLRVLGGAELRSYAPPERFWVLRRLWHDEEASCQDHGVADENVRLVVIRITFRNDSAVPVELGFDNTACKAEFQNLEITDGTGTQLEPVRNLHIQPKRGSGTSHRIDRRDEYTIDLVGEVIGNSIIFPGAKYTIPQDGDLRITFNYRGLKSNVSHLQI